LKAAYLENVEKRKTNAPEDGSLDRDGRRRWAFFISGDGAGFFIPELNMADMADVYECQPGRSNSLAAPTLFAPGVRAATRTYRSLSFIVCPRLTEPVIVLAYATHAVIV
jgi:hypothetical protein